MSEAPNLSEMLLDVAIALDGLVEENPGLPADIVALIREAEDACNDRRAEQVS